MSFGSTVDALPGYGVALTEADRAVMTGYLDDSGRARVYLGGTPNETGFTQVGLFDTDGEVTMSRCVCSR